MAVVIRWTSVSAAALIVGVVAGLIFYFYGGDGHAAEVDVNPGKTSVDTPMVVDSVNRKIGAADDPSRVLVSGAERGSLSFRLISALTGSPVLDRPVDLVVTTSGAVMRTVMTGKDGRFRLALDEDSKSVRLVVALGDHWAQSFDLSPKRGDSLRVGERSLVLHDLCEVQIAVPGVDNVEIEMGVVQLAVVETVLPEAVVALPGLGGQIRTLSRQLTSRRTSLRVPHGTRFKVSLKSINEVITSSSQEAVAPCRLSFFLTRKPVILVRFLPTPNDVKTCSVLYGRLRGNVFEHTGFLADQFPVLNHMSLIPIEDLPRYKGDRQLVFRIIGLGDTWFGQSEFVEGLRKAGGPRFELVVAVSKRVGVSVRVVSEETSGLRLRPYVLTAGGSLRAYPTADRGDGYGMIQKTNEGFLLRNLGRIVSLVVADTYNSVFLPARVAPWDKEIVVRARKQESGVLERGRAFAIRATESLSLKDGSFHVLIQRRFRVFGRETWQTCRMYRVALPYQRKGPFTDSFWNISTGHDYRVRILVSGHNFSLSPVFTH